MLSLNEASASSRRLKVCEGNLALLKEKLAADPDSYVAEFGEQFEHFQRHLKLLELQPQLHSSSINAILQLSDFLSASALHYPEKAAHFGALTMSVLSGAQVSQMDPELRIGLCKCVVSMAMARVVELPAVVQLMFQLLRCDDKQLRKFILTSLIAFIRRCTKGSAIRKKKHKKRQKCGRLAQQQGAKLQQTLFAMLNDSSAVCARVAQLALVEAYRRQYWRDPKTANALAQCVFHRVQRVQVSTMRFFLGPAHEGEEEEESSDEEGGGKDTSRTLKEVLQQFRHAKKTKKRKKQVEQAKQAMGGERKKRKEKGAKQCNLEAIRSIHDPQRFADRLFGTLDGRKNEKYAIRLLQIALCARVIGVHKLQTLGFYSYLHRYLQPKQKEVTRILLYAAQACHELVPPDVVEQLVRVVAQNFVSDRNTPEAITVGLNTIREIYANCPAAAAEEIVRDLAEYKKMHNKNVSMAARALITLIRAQNPKLLHHKDRGRPTEPRSVVGEYGAGFGKLKAFDHVPGAEVLPEDAEEAERLAQMARSSDESADEDEEEDDVEEADEKEEGGMDEAEETMEVEEDEEEEVEEDEDEEGWMTASEEEEDDEEEEEEEGEPMMEAEEADDEDGKEDKAEKDTRKKLSRMKGAQKQLRKSAKRARVTESRQEQLARAQQISSGRILSDADFRLIRIRQLRLQARLQDSRKRTNDEERLEEHAEEKRARAETGDGLPRLQDIEHFHRKIRRQTKEERMEQIREGRPGREAYGKPKKGPHVGRTNRELAKRKPAQMVRQKVRGRNRQRSFRDRQQSLRKFLLRQQGKKV